MPAPDDQPEPFPLGDGLSPEFAADMAARMQAYFTAMGLSQQMLTPLDQEAVAMHVVFSALVQAGFTDDQAIKYLAWRRV